MQIQLLFVCVIIIETNTYVIGNCKVNNCQAECTGWEMASSGKQIEENKGNCTTIELQINDAEFPEDILPANWLVDLTATVIKLLFNKATFVEIAEEALDLNALLGLTFISCQLGHFAKGPFNTLRSLETFYVSGCQQPIAFDAGFLENSLQLGSIQIESCDFDVNTLLNLTGLQGSLGSIKSLYLQQAGKLKYLPAFFVTNAKKLEQIFLNDCDLQTIAKEAFWFVNVSQIYLNSNNLSTLEKGVFDHLYSGPNRKVRLNLQDNKWQCDCRLKWLQTEYLADPERFLLSEIGPLYCANGDRFDEVEFCEDDETTTTTTVEPPPEQNIITIDCRNGALLSEDPPEMRLEFITEIQISIAQSEHQLVEMTFYDIYNAPTSAQIKIAFAAQPLGINLIYFEIFTPDEVSCIANIQQSLILSDLLRNHTYTFCLLADGEVTVPPTACFGFQVPAEWSERTWLRNKSKEWIIAIAAATILLAMLLSTLVTYGVVRYHPQLIEGNSDVIIVKRNKNINNKKRGGVGGGGGRNQQEKLPLPPREFDVPAEYTEPSPTILTTQASGYLTPMPQYEKINYYTRLSNSVYGGGSSNGGGAGAYIQPPPLRRIDEVETYVSSARRLPRVDKDRIYY